MKIISINGVKYNADRIHSFWWDAKNLSFHIKIGVVSYTFKDPRVGINYSEVQRLEDFLLDERKSPCYNSYAIYLPEDNDNPQ